MRRSLISVVVLIVACNGTAEVTTTTSQSASTTDAPQTLIPGGLIPADPATLVPFEDAEAVVLGHSHDGVVSPDGRWAAVRTEQAEDGGPLVSIIDLSSMVVVADQEGSGQGLQVGDDGTTVWFQEGQLHRFEVTGEETTIEAPPAPAYFEDTLSILPDGRLAYLSGPVDEPGTVSVVVVADDGITLHEIDQLSSGPLVGGGSSERPREFNVPDVAWDVVNNRALVVSPHEDLIVVVDLSTGHIDEHEFATNHPSGDLTRDAHVNADGSSLFIATALLEMEAEGDTAVQSAQQLVVVDTSDWSSRLVSVTADTIYPSPEDSLIATTGIDVTVGTEDEERSQSPVFLVDTTTGEPLVGFEGRAGIATGVEFSNDGAEMYVISAGPDGSNIDIVDVATEQLAGSLGFTRISLIGEAGLLSFHVSD